ncbi:hypothetical protein [Streptomonospora salina]|uniref:Uncharacterized protein n=1 Tax=Streptomonospora salina TaxID=104205 RepID=A0A841EF20_9ACTN|nr:hypothetical protein [Streptomonospora salina]MBB5999929.1 hypothetical protein [Streptomonospora salina]
MTSSHPLDRSAFAITGTTAALLVVVLLTTPLQAADEESTFRATSSPHTTKTITDFESALISRRPVVG